LSNLSIAHKDELEVAVLKKQNDSEVEFDYLIDLFEITDYESTALYGYVNLISSITQSVSYSARRSIVLYVYDIKENEVALHYFLQLLCDICLEVQTKLKTSRANRIISPLLGFIEIMLESGFLVDYTYYQHLDFILDFVLKRCQNSTNPQRLTVGISICCWMLQFNDKPLKFLMACLMHKYPVIRIETANKMDEVLCVKLLNHDMVILYYADWCSGNLEELAGCAADIESLLKRIL